MTFNTRLNKILMYEFCYDYVKQKYGEKKARLCYIDTDSFIAYIKTDDICKKMLKLDLILQIMNKIAFYWKKKIKKIGLKKDELGGKIMTKFVGLRAKTYSSLIDHESED